mgnify:FL=1
MLMSWFCNGVGLADCGWFLATIGMPIVMAMILWMTEK